MHFYPGPGLVSKRPARHGSCHMETHHQPVSAAPGAAGQENPVWVASMTPASAAAVQGDAGVAEPAVFLEREKLLLSLLTQIWNVMLLVALLGGVASIQRFRFAGWMPIYSLHSLIILAFVTCWLMHKRLSFNPRVGIIMTIFYMVGVTGLFSSGLIGAGIWWLILCSLIASVF
jgi:hypothetical protein